MYDLNQIPYNYTVEVTNTFKGLDVTERVPQELWTEVHNIVQEVMTKTILKGKKKNARRQGGCLRRLIKEEEPKAKEKGKDIPNWMRSTRVKQR